MMSAPLDARTSASPMADVRPLALHVRDLSVVVDTPHGPVTVIDGVDLSVASGTVHAVIGASGAGKSTLLRAIGGGLARETHATGEVRLDPLGGPDALGATAPGGSGIDVLAATGARTTTRSLLPPTTPIAGTVIGWVPQSAATALTPVRTLGAQLAETCMVLGALSSPDELLRSVGLDPADGELHPHELSGGMAQRAAVALGMVGNPSLLLADEPTSSLDLDLRRQLLALLRGHADRGGTVVLVTHDLAALASSGVADAVTVLDGGRVVESGPAADLLGNPSHRVTRRLLVGRAAYQPSGAKRQPDDSSGSLVAQSISYAVPPVPWRPSRPLLDRVDLAVGPGEVVALTGPSGIGKTTLLRLLGGLEVPDSGRVLLGDVSVEDVRTRAGRVVRGRIAMVLQSPRAALDPRLRLSRSVELAAAATVRRGVVAEREWSAELAALAVGLGLDERLLARRAHEVSDGQLQRVALLRAFAQAPDVLLGDEVTAALDPATAHEVVTAIAEHAHRRGGAVLLATHDLDLASSVADRVLTIDRGGRVR